ncbi:UbiA prenyltransferase [Nitrosococcus halophilus Nc 4]|uniref:UbiA prenyltransferase n=1 Tax=Nitrosococcus halophilus (strain Nc4) TaxID=472759 RepID=D5C549_NITHN|nr:decaprenyl-phosphate phosphoribosyltransferase [Nitrosococcus halophilus]ADE15272.1 UbiA prenyltransferase [Nitrosococcus halophilus Nc 4]
MNHPRALLHLMRPHQWLKNSFVFVGVFFGHAWNNLTLVILTIVMAVAFSLLSSAIYIINDLSDRESDRNHPIKRHRPLAAGTVSIGIAIGLAAVLLVVSLGLGLWVSQAALLILLGYAFMNLAYSFRLKHVVLLDVFIIAAGFLLRILAGTVGVGIPPSQWLVLCSLMLTLFLGFAKRRAEIMTLQEGSVEHRRVLVYYSPILLDKMITVTAACVLMSYGLYTMSPETIRIHQTENLIYTLPLVMYAIFRYIFLLHHRGKGGEPSRDLMRDPHILISVAGWVVLTFWLIY